MSNGSDNNRDQEIIEIVRPTVASWAPEVGPETLRLLGVSNLSLESRGTTRDEALSILRRCVSPSGSAGAGTGLIVGYVQSGKTMSFTTITALARDNGFPMVIVIAGTSIPLTNQSQERLRRDLGLGERDDRKWLHIHNPKGANVARMIEDTLVEWGDSTVPETERRTVLLTIMKNHRWLNHLIGVMRQVSMDRIPVLIIDDEADQAGLNNLIRQGEESTTYRRLCALKRMLPHHTFLQYTATPQGPLLINIIDVLSPDFAYVLTPGPDYVGGQEFFQPDHDLSRDIPPGDIPSADNPLHEPPDSLLYALRFFFLGVAVGLLRDGGQGNRSMMIHPSQRIIPHGQYFDWVVNTRESWLRILQAPHDPDYPDLIDDFRVAYEDLCRTAPAIEPFERVTARLLHAIRRTVLHQVNTSRGKTPPIDWRNTYSHILVGGQAMDRGFTVEGLTVTYMPRGVGVGNADTIQQRARFLGYKRGYLGFCRVFLEPDVADALRDYVEHEEDVRRRLSEYAANGRPLAELRRIFLLTRALRPTRDSIIDIGYNRVCFDEGWFYPKSPHESPDNGAANRNIVESFLRDMCLTLDTGHPDRSEHQRHSVVENISLSQVYERFLTNLSFSNMDDSQNFVGALEVIQSYLEGNAGATCSIYLMSQGQQRERTLDEDGKILNLFQGAHPVNPPERRGEIYPGDRSIRCSGGLTVQIHMLRLRDRVSGATLDGVPNIALYIPGEIASDLIIQQQGDNGGQP